MKRAIFFMIEFLKLWFMCYGAVCLVWNIVKVVRKKKPIEIRIVYQIIWQRSEIREGNVTQNIWDVIIRSYRGYSAEKAIGDFLISTQNIDALQKLPAKTFVINISN